MSDDKSKLSQVFIAEKMNPVVGASLFHVGKVHRIVHVPKHINVTESNSFHCVAQLVDHLFASIIQTFEFSRFSPGE
jgi:hypothetical protein